MISSEHMNLFKLAKHDSHQVDTSKFPVLAALLLWLSIQCSLNGFKLSTRASGPSVYALSYSDAVNMTAKMFRLVVCGFNSA
jgi:hypothetical protein